MAFVMKMLPRILVLSVTAVVLFCASDLVWLPFHEGWAYDQKGRFCFGDYATWIQGVLTPFAVLVGGLTLYWQWRSLRDTLREQRDANNRQREANSRTLLGIMLDNREALENHLNYMTCTAILQERKSDHEVMKKGRMAWINDVLYAGVIIEPGKHLSDLKADVEKVIGMAQESGTLSFLDHRILELADKLRN